LGCQTLHSALHAPFPQNSSFQEYSAYASGRSRSLSRHGLRRRSLPAGSIAMSLGRPFTTRSRPTPASTPCILPRSAACPTTATVFLHSQPQSRIITPIERPSTNSERPPPALPDVAARSLTKKLAQNGLILEKGRVSMGRGRLLGCESDVNLIASAWQDKALKYVSEIATEFSARLHIFVAPENESMP